MASLAHVKALLAGAGGDLGASPAERLRSEALSWGGSWTAASRGAIMGSPKGLHTMLHAGQVADVVHEVCAK